MRVDLDIPVHCVDGGFGELADVVIDPRTRRLTHLVVQPDSGYGNARLVRLEDAHRGGGSQGIQLGCTIAEVLDCEAIQEAAYLRIGELLTGEGDWDVGIQDMSPLPEYGSLGTDALGAGLGVDYDQHISVSYHRVPKGQVEIRRESPVTAAGGEHLGHVTGFV